MSVVGITIQGFYLLTLHKALTRVSPGNRLMEPWMVWLSLIPFFRIVWNFFIATWIPGSLRNEFIDRGENEGTDYGKAIGLANAIAQVFFIAIALMQGTVRSSSLGIIRLPLALVCLVLFIQFWVKIAGYSRRLANPPKYSENALNHEDSISASPFPQNK
jgi:hypothetical protein